MASIGGAVVEATKMLKQKWLDCSATKNVYKDATTNDILLSGNGISYQQANAQFIPMLTCGRTIRSTRLMSKQVQLQAKAQKFAFCSSAEHYCIVRVHAKTEKLKSTAW